MWLRAGKGGVAGGGTGSSGNHAAALPHEGPSMTAISRSRPERPARFCLFGAAPDTANLGVSALYLSILHGILDRVPDADITVFDHGPGIRMARERHRDRWVPIRRCGANLTRRALHRSDSLIRMSVSARLGGLGNPGVGMISAADAVLDISGGDSFTDLYGPRRFRNIARMKDMALRLGVPLVLMPQTYGPFVGREKKAIAAGIVRRAHMAWGRDRRSFETLADLLGGAFDGDRHREGVDVAFALPTREPQGLPVEIRDFAFAGDRPLVGLNVSGLIYNQGTDGSRYFGFRSDYRDIVHGLVGTFLDRSDARILLVPHVMAPVGTVESDVAACRAVADRVARPDRIAVLDRPLDATEAKWVISKTDFFCGTRMHSTIAGLSSGVPTAAIAYSRKTLGVFESCGQGKWVADPRTLDGEACVAAVWQAFEARADIALSLARQLPQVRRRAEDQMDRIVASVGGTRTLTAAAA